MPFSLAGILAAIAAYVLWGVLPVYWKALAAVPAKNILCHRMVWSLLVTLLLIFLLGRWRSLRTLMGDGRSRKLFTLAALLLAGNWLLYIWAVNAGHVIEASLGYFINPLVSVLFGLLFLGERLRVGQVCALMIALGGVVYLTFWYGQFPWIALLLAASFGTYGLLHKKIKAPALEGLSLETMVLFAPALIALVVLESGGNGSFLAGPPNQVLLLVGSGVITSLPLLLFGFAAQRISLTQLGLLQYIAPSINLVLGIYLYHEPFPPERMMGFAMIWSALALYLLESGVLWKRQHQLRSLQGK